MTMIKKIKQTQNVYPSRKGHKRAYIITKYYKNRLYNTIKCGKTRRDENCCTELISVSNERKSVNKN